nr:ME53 [Calliteara abietis nucleopolyhedrovirus]
MVLKHTDVYNKYINEVAVENTNNQSIMNVVNNNNNNNNKNKNKTDKSNCVSAANTVCGDFQELHIKFLSFEQVKLMKALMRFATDYVTGNYKLNNLALMNCGNLKRNTEYVFNSMCDKCKKEFRHFVAETRELHCVINTKVSVETENNFKLICGKCCRIFNKNIGKCNSGNAINMAVATTKIAAAQNVATKQSSSSSSSSSSPPSTWVTYQLFPRLTLDTVETLCKVNFVTKYLFNIERRSKRQKVIYQDRIRDVTQSLDDIVASKLDNECIVKISLLTYEKVIFTETLNDCAIEYKNGAAVVNFAPPEPSSTPGGFHDKPCARFSKNYTFQSLTYFYEIEKIVFENIECNYTVYFARPFIPYNKRGNCSKCRKKFYKSNIILYCSKCGFTNRMHYTLPIDNVDPSSMLYFPECVKAIKNKLFCIVYYDMVLYKRKYHQQQVANNSSNGGVGSSSSNITNNNSNNNVLVKRY